MKFIQAKNYKKGNNRSIDLIVIHTMEAAETYQTAENVAKWFAGSNAPIASAHYCLDGDSIVQCVKDEDIAYHCKGANDNSIGFEHAGYAKQTSENWHDEYSKKLLELSSELCAKLCIKYNIPIKFINANGLKNKERGITTHGEVTKAFAIPGGHVDPGKNFPINEYIIMVESYIAFPNE